MELFHLDRRIPEAVLLKPYSHLEREEIQHQSENRDYP